MAEEIKIHTGNQMQAIATANAKADITKQGKKYGNLRGDLWFEKFNAAQQQSISASAYLSQKIYYKVKKKNE